MSLSYIGTRTSTNKGVPFKRMREDVESFSMTDFSASHYGDGLLSIGSVNVKNLELKDAVLDDFYRVLYMPYANGVLSSFTVSHITATNLERGFSHLKEAHDGYFLDVEAVARLGTTTDIPCGFATGDYPTSDIVYERCYAGGFQQHRKEGSYWNGDGFSDERQATGMAYLNCAAMDNADAGLDTKSVGVVVRGFSSYGNGRNLRLWGSGTIEDFASKDPRNAHIWVGGEDRLGTYTITRPVFSGGSDKPHIQIESGWDGAKIIVIDPVVPAGEELRIVQSGTGLRVPVEISYTKPARVPRVLPTTVVVDGATYSGELTEVLEEKS